MCETCNTNAVRFDGPGWVEWDRRDEPVLSRYGTESLEQPTAAIRPPLSQAARKRSVEVGDLAGQIAGWENEKPPDLLSYKERKRVQNALHQFHLPKLDDHGLIEYDSQRKTVTLTDAAADQDFYIDVVPKRDIPWSLYYLGYALLSGLVLVGGWAQVWPVTLLETELWGVFFVTIILFSSLVHVHDSKRHMRLGARETPRR
ncbi:hypothetical protein ACFQH8_03795 [Halomicroarcula sp. GCM10025710]